MSTRGQLGGPLQLFAKARARSADDGRERGFRATVAIEQKRVIRAAFHGPVV